MARLGKENVFLVEVDDKFALIDQNSGKIHVVDAANAKAWENGEDFEAISITKSLAICDANSSVTPDEYFEEEDIELEG